MKRFILLLITIFLFGGSADVCAQTYLERLGKSAIDRAKYRAKTKVENKIDEAVDKGVDNLFDAADKKNKKKSSNKNGEEEAENEGAQEQASKDKATKQDAKPEKNQKNTEMTYAKSDFVRGDEVFFDDQLVGEQLGEFPSQWDAINGSVEIGKINGENVIIAQETWDQIAPLFDDMKSYLPEKFTLEFDFWCDKPNPDEFNRYYVNFKDENNNVLQKVYIEKVGVDDNAAGVAWGYAPMSGDDWRSGNLDGIKWNFSDWNHCAVSFNKRAMKIYINGVRITNIPNTVQPSNFSIEFVGDDLGHFTNPAIRNIVLAKGAVPLYDRMMNDGKFITYGITFDVGKSVVKPESMGEITRIVQLMTENPSLSFSVEGHTDSTGNAASNQKLSEDRAKAIVDKLVENGISRSRLTAVGKGQSSPIADNGTDEGRAKNRRVEFVKL